MTVKNMRYGNVLHKAPLKPVSKPVHTGPVVAILVDCSMSIANFTEYRARAIDAFRDEWALHDPDNTFVVPYTDRAFGHQAKDLEDMVDTLNRVMNRSGVGMLSAGLDVAGDLEATHIVVITDEERVVAHAAPTNPLIRKAIIICGEREVARARRVFFSKEKC